RAALEGAKQDRWTVPVLVRAGSACAPLTPPQPRRRASFRPSIEYEPDMTSTIETVRAEDEGAAGRLRLNRPKALHALDLEMVKATTAALLRWRDNPAIRLVMIDHAEGRGFCAGGDVVTIANSVGEQDGVAEEFFLHEY